MRKKKKIISGWVFVETFQSSIKVFSSCSLKLNIKVKLFCFILWNPCPRIWQKKSFLSSFRIMYLYSVISIKWGVYGLNVVTHLISLSPFMRLTWKSSTEYALSGNSGSNNNRYNSPDSDQALWSSDSFKWCRTCSMKESAKWSPTVGLFVLGSCKIMK